MYAPVCPRMPCRWSKHGASGSAAVLSSAAGTAGAVTVCSGAAAVGDSGAIALSTGDAVAASGDVLLSVGAGASSRGGDVRVAAGPVRGGEGVGGTVHVQSGSSALPLRVTL